MTGPPGKQRPPVRLLGGGAPRVSKFNDKSRKTSWNIDSSVSRVKNRKRPFIGVTGRYGNARSPRKGCFKRLLTVSNAVKRGVTRNGAFKETASLTAVCWQAKRALRDKRGAFVSESLPNAHAYAQQTGGNAPMATGRIGAQ